jgi:hypothetical protein
MVLLEDFQNWVIKLLHLDPVAASGQDFIASPALILFAKIVFVIYIVSLLFTTFYCLMQFQLYYNYIKYRRKYPKDPPPPSPISDDKLPMVTIQLPMFNEKYVVEKLVDIMMKFDYPKYKFEVHVIDDSNDETVEIAQAKVKEWKEKGFNIEWQGEGLNEVGIDKNTSKILIKINPKYFRPSEVDELLGDSTKAKTLLGWNIETSFDKLIDEMVENDCK